MTDRSPVPPLDILDYRDDLARHFHDLNAEWIERMFRLEPIDRDVLTHPRERIIDKGGIILFAAIGSAVIGTVALMPVGDGSFEVTKMAVSPAAQGRKAGERLLGALLDRANQLGIARIHLLTNSLCAPAIHLYEKLGFAHDEETMRRYGTDYARCDVAMAYRREPLTERVAANGERGDAETSDSL
jgi:N-acetylglutamate synthase-like GNAT family acetyltransferase